MWCKRQIFTASNHGTSKAKGLFAPKLFGFYENLFNLSCFYSNCERGSAGEQCKCILHLYFIVHALICKLFINHHMVYPGYQVIPIVSILFCEWNVHICTFFTKYIWQCKKIWRHVSVRHRRQLFIVSNSWSILNDTFLVDFIFLS